MLDTVVSINLPKSKGKVWFVVVGIIPPAPHHRNWPKDQGPIAPTMPFTGVKLASIHSMVSLY
jgi:hypothetical protein